MSYDMIMIMKMIHMREIVHCSVHIPQKWKRHKFAAKKNERMKNLTWGHSEFVDIKRIWKNLDKLKFQRFSKIQIFQKNNGFQKFKFFKKITVFKNSISRNFQKKSSLDTSSVTYQIDSISLHLFHKKRAQKILKMTRETHDYIHTYCMIIIIAVTLPQYLCINLSENEHLQ